MRDREREGGKSERGGSSRGGGGFSLSSKAAVVAGLFSSGPATIKESVFAEYNYGGSSKPVPVWLITFAREGEQDYEQPYSLGSGWKIGKNGELIPRAGQTGLPDSCNAMRHLVRPLEKCDVPQDLLDAADPSFLEGAKVIVKRVPQEKRDGLKGAKGGEEKERTILEIEEIVEAPWESKSDKGSAKSKAKPSRDDDDDDDNDDDKPKGKSKSRRDADEDDDDDEKPTRGGKSSTKGKSHDNDDDDDLTEEAVEALIAVLDDGPLKVAAIADAVRDSLKKHPQAKAIAALAEDPDFLEKEKGWTFDGKKVTLD